MPWKILSGKLMPCLKVQLLEEQITPKIRHNISAIPLYITDHLEYTRNMKTTQKTVNEFGWTAMDYLENNLQTWIDLAEDNAKSKLRNREGIKWRKLALEECQRAREEFLDGVEVRDRAEPMTLEKWQNTRELRELGFVYGDGSAIDLLEDGRFQIIPARMIDEYTNLAEAASIIRMIDEYTNLAEAEAVLWKRSSQFNYP